MEEKLNETEKGQTKVYIENRFFCMRELSSKAYRGTKVQKNVRGPLCCLKALCSVRVCDEPSTGSQFAVEPTELHYSCCVLKEITTFPLRFTMILQN